MVGNEGLTINVLTVFPSRLLEVLVADEQLGPLFQRIDRERFIAMMSSMFMIMSADNALDDPHNLKTVIDNMSMWHKRVPLSAALTSRWLDCCHSTLVELGEQPRVATHVVSVLRRVLANFTDSKDKQPEGQAGLSGGGPAPSAPGQAAPQPLSSIYSTHETEMSRQQSRDSAEFSRHYPM